MIIIYETYKFRKIAKIKAVRNQFFFKNRFLGK
jgi:hypothetical protein